MNLVEFYFYYIIEKIYFFINIQNILFKTINIYIYIIVFFFCLRNLNPLISLFNK